MPTYIKIELNIDKGAKYCGCCTMRNFSYEDDVYCNAFDERLGMLGGEDFIRTQKCIESEV